MNTPRFQMQLVVITGMSGSGKSVALHALEDSGFYCVDNLPPELLESFVAVAREHRTERVAVAIDVRSGNTLSGLPAHIGKIRQDGQPLIILFLDATNDALVRRFSETRRMHPLSLKSTSDQSRALVEAIELERELLADLRELALVIDTSMRRASQLRSEVKKLLDHDPSRLTLVFESFAFKRGIPMDADFVFDVRMLPNPHYEPDLRPLTGLDGPVADFLSLEPAVQGMQVQITNFLNHWLPAMVRDHRSYVTVGIGCTGGQHRSVYLVEELARHFGAEWAVQRRHRELDAPRSAGH